MVSANQECFFPSRDVQTIAQLEASALKLAESLSDISSGTATAALEAAEDLQRRVKVLEDRLQHSEFLPVFRDPIGRFRAFIARDMGYNSWPSLADGLMMEEDRQQRPVLQALQEVLEANSLDIKVWDDLKLVAAAGIGSFQQGKHINSLQALHIVRNHDIPKCLQHTKGSLDAAFLWLAKRGTAA
ncbi:hypothetical protein WJX74_010918 [Apatococcus lobatus]|uniref:Uncharacterized protein n=1 Tax=Apatococcus lobatus TaxID=904363 RepID=A0AAW1RW70_9CHLO